VTFTGSASSSAQFPRDGLPEVAFLGRSNVGKSSVLNALTGVRGLARVSSEPGRTRLVNFFYVRGATRPGRGGRGDLYLVDLPGPSEGDELLRAYLEQNGRPYVVAANKVDKLAGATSVAGSAICGPESGRGRRRSYR
jgi:GTP-binding protein EngB required for normal cell division